MSDFGGKLRQARERRGISLRQIAASTKISVTALEALERNDVSRLAGGIFSRSFVRAYAMEVGLDPDETVREFLQRFEDVPPPGETRGHPVPHGDSILERRQHLALRVLTLVTIGVPLVAVILYFTWRSRASPSPPGRATPGAAAHASGIAAPRAEAPPSSAARPAAAPSASPGVPPVADPGAASANAAAPMRLEIHPTAACWVSLTVDGRKVFARVMQAGERDVRPVEHDAIVEVGDAGAFAFTVDGREGRALGGSGQVRTLKLTRATFTQYVK